MSELVIWEREAARIALTGVFLPVPALEAPCTIRVFLEEVLGLPHAYVEERIQTLLLNGLAVDDPDTAVLESGARLALSAAMPGVLGATLRRGGHYAPMRRSITLESTGDLEWAKGFREPFWVELRCFNEIAREQGFALARHGVGVPAEALGNALRPLASSLPTSLPTPPRGDLLWLHLPQNAA